MRPWSEFEAAGDAGARPHAECYWLIPGALLAGEHPGLAGPEAVGSRLAALKACGITRLVDLSAARDAVAPYAQHLQDFAPLQRDSFPITDFGVPTRQGMRATLDAIEQALAEGERLYLHCKAGIGRTGTVAACLMVDRGVPPARALELLARKWQAVAKRGREPHTPETEAQRAFVMAWRPGAC